LIALTTTLRIFNLYSRKGPKEVNLRTFKGEETETAMNKIGFNSDFNLKVFRDLNPEVVTFFEAPAFYRSYKFFRLSSRGIDGVINRCSCEVNPENSVPNRLDVRPGGDDTKINSDFSIS
jgi:hypothetical protein